MHIFSPFLRILAATSKYIIQGGKGKDNGAKMEVTKSVADYIRLNYTSLSELSRETGIPYRCLYYSLGKNSNRELRAGELLKNCKVVGVNPMDFA